MKLYLQRVPKAQRSTEIHFLAAVHPLWYHFDN